MSKLTLTFFVFCFFNHLADAQDTTWRDNKGNLVMPQKGFYFRTTVRTDSGWQVTDHYRNGITEMTGLYLDAFFKTKQGVFRWYMDDGSPTLLRTYVDGKNDGPYEEYYENGTIRLQGMQLDGKREGEWKAYFPGGKLAAEGVYHADKQTSRILYHEDGSLNSNDTIFYRDSKYPGGLPAYLRFLNRKLRYPASASANSVEGTVFLFFHVSIEGKIEDLRVMQSAGDPELDAEALRVLRLMADWEPAIVGGQRVKSWHVQPVVFSLSGR